jgi:hypothetical protein
MLRIRFWRIVGLALSIACVATQVHALTAGPNSPGATFNDVSFGTVAWTNPGNGLASDDAYAQASPGGGNTNYLAANNFNLAVPASAIIDGIEVAIEKRSLAGTVLDSRVRIIKGGVIGSTERADGATWPTTDTVVVYGGLGDLWGETWTAADVNAPSFGVAVSATDSLDTAAIDHITITVHYSLCPQTPLPGCLTSAKGLLLVKDNPDDNKDKIIWKLTNAATTSQQDFEDPTATTTYAICMFENGALSHGVTVPPSGALWVPIATVGFKYKDLAGSAQGIQRIILRGSDDNRTKIIVKGKGMALPDPVPALTLPVVVQLVNSDSGQCWEGTFDAPNIRRNEPGIFKSNFSN